ncbi:MAG: hypothetical protein RMJ56_06180 [Gemmataceae bacterium]|nr:hypothetical protein [Gemmata sp.]MDW8197177.1 hypothetical protein [Gemmataceae bacterium]
MTTLPIRRVVLYKHGVGYFERETQVVGDQSFSLSFKQREVSDVLKSLTVLDLHGGTVATVSYDSTTPIEQLLAEIALSIPDNGSLVGLLPQLKGARAAVKPSGSSSVTGVILGIDQWESHGDGGTITQPRLALLTDAGDVRTFDLFALELTLLDDGLKRDLDFYLRTQLASKKKDARTFTFFAQGPGERTVRISYVLEAPVWKATYRILLDEDPGANQPPTPRIQGWAVVDNTSDEDWHDVELTLVAGLPVSFVHDLYTPRYIKRPVVEVKETTGVLPPMLAAAAEQFPEAEAKRSIMLSPAMDRTAMAYHAQELSASSPGAARANKLASAASSVPLQTRERQIGDLFEYIIEKPVTVRRNQSALVPILLKPFTGRRALLYQKAARAENPLRCVEFENTTGLTLEGGPVTVLERGSYVGEAMLDTLKPNEKRLLAYAVELAVRVVDNIDSDASSVTRIIIRKGTLQTEHAQWKKTTYTFTSQSDQEQLVYLDHPREEAEWRLVEPATAYETTENSWRFRFTIAPKTTTKFVVHQQKTFYRSWNLKDITDQQLGAWIAAKYLDKTSEKALRELLAQQQTLSRIEEKLQQLRQERENIFNEQERIRQNLSALGDRASDRELRERFVAILSQQEDQLALIRKDEQKLHNERNAAREQLDDLLGKFHFETSLG